MLIVSVVVIIPVCSMTVISVKAKSKRLKECKIIA